MDNEAIISALKILGAVIGGALGVVGLVANFKKRSGRLSRSGIAVLVGILLSAAVGVGTSLVESYKARFQATVQAAITKKLLHEISRTLQPITKLEASYSVEIPPGVKTVDDYIKRLSAGVEARIDSLKKFDVKNIDSGLSVRAYGRDENPSDIEINVKSDLWPRGNEGFIVALTKVFSISVFILKDPVDPKIFSPVFQSGQIDFFLGGSGQQKETVLLWDRQTKRLYFSVRVEFDEARMEKNGRITSLPDLLGSQIVLLIPALNDYVQPAKSSTSRDRGADDDFDEVHRALEIKNMSLTFAEGRTIWLSGSKFKKSRSGTGHPAFSIILPDNEGEFKEFTKSSDE